jgi:MFS family permease
MVQLAVGINAVLFPVTLQSFGYSKTLIGACLSLEVLAVVVISQYLSTIIARVGIGRALIIATLVRATCLYILSSSGNYAVWLICVFFFGMNTNIMLISLQTWINTIPLKNNKGLVIGIFSSALSLGTAAGPLIASLTEGRLLFFIDIAIVGLTVLPFMLIYRSIPSIAAPPRPRILYAIQTAKIYMFSAFVGGITFFGLPAFLTIYGMMNNLSIEKSAFLISMFMLGSISLGFLIASVSDLVNRLYVIISCVFVGLIAAIYLPLAIYSYPQALILLFIWGGVSGGIYATGLARVGELFFNN